MRVPNRFFDIQDSAYLKARNLRILKAIGGKFWDWNYKWKRRFGNFMKRQTKYLILKKCFSEHLMSRDHWMAKQVHIFKAIYPVFHWLISCYDNKDTTQLALTSGGWPNSEKPSSPCVQIWSWPKCAQVNTNAHKTCTQPTFMNIFKKGMLFLHCKNIPSPITPFLPYPNSTPIPYCADRCMLSMNLCTYQWPSRGLTLGTYGGIAQDLLTFVSNFCPGMGVLDCFCTSKAIDIRKD